MKIVEQTRNAQVESSSDLSQATPEKIAAIDSSVLDQTLESIVPVRKPMRFKVKRSMLKVDLAE